MLIAVVGSDRMFGKLYREKATLEFVHSRYVGKNCEFVSVVC